jgi:carbon monoxide dehydrogenase subunit G
MSFTATISVSRHFDSPALPDRVFELLADVPRSASHFPDVERIDDLGGNSFRWTMEKIGIGEYTLQQTIYACNYRSDLQKLKVDWVPVDGVGNALVEGSWSLSPAAAGTRLQFETKGRLQVDLPGFLQFLLSPLIEMAFAQKIDRYISNLSETLRRL